MATSSPSSYWQVGKTLPECFDHVFTSGIVSDVTFLVGEEMERISAHKLVLMSRSPVFYAMLEGPIADKGDIPIPDISDETFKLFLRYLYTDSIDLTLRNVVPVLNAARKYFVDILVSHCEKFLASNLSSDNACLFLEQAHVFVMDSLKSDCLRFIDENPTAALTSEAFTDLCVSCVTSITESDDLRVTENNVYEAIIRWAEAECARQNLETTANNKREVLGETLYTVRYLHVDEEFLLGKICSDKILKPDDVVEIINHKRNKKPLISKKLMTKRRFGNPERFYRNGPVINDFWNAPVDEAISFKTDSDVHLFGFGSFFTNVTQSTVDLKVFEEDVCLVQANKTAEPSQPDTPHMGDVLLDTPIPLHAGRKYTIVECPSNPFRYYFTKGIAKVTNQHVTIEFSNSSRSRHTDTDWGQIPYLLLS
ncbi:BTB/POZ domain-containing protein 2-like [Mizuhopecten yessoensis]|uniref:BTB/POZ domain-containing protein 2 n=1 Tax=Mizuhopecten yessoensis TaxID=6573 RepID=A0A210R3D2_MIZYE|nr:BTB/POZ domain-containing protein 2-like [Mizuhopecten yessoensis]OWF55517.1 BTB/POZ domain-containing protein 2 [Mizuhopecten yessoensis]